VAGQTGETRREIRAFIVYMETQWIKKIDSSNLWNFNNLPRVRSTNAAESYHSLIVKYTLLLIFLLSC
jgi:hypothetical protein